MNPRFLAHRRAPRAELLEPLSDEELAELIAQGHEEAFEVLVVRHRRVLVNHCSQLVGRADAEEAVQEALLRAYLSLSRGHSVQRVGAWLRTIAHNTALNLLRARKARPVADDHEPRGVAGDPFERREHLALILEALGSLPDRQREALVMRELEGRSYAEIESRLRTSNGAVRQLLNRARARLRTRLGTLTGLEPALRWMLGNGNAGSSAVRLGALGGGCAVTVKLCAVALLPATLGTGSGPASRAKLPAMHDHAHVATTRTASTAILWSVGSGGMPAVAVRFGSHQAGSLPSGTVFVAYHPGSATSTTSGRIHRATFAEPSNAPSSGSWPGGGGGGDGGRSLGGRGPSGGGASYNRGGGGQSGGGGGFDTERQGYAASAGEPSGSGGADTSSTPYSSSSNTGTGSSSSVATSQPAMASTQWSSSSSPGGSATSDSRPGEGALAASGSPEELSSTTP